MNSFGRLCIGVGVTGILLVGWARAMPGGWRGPAGDIVQLPDILSQIAAEEQLGAELQDISAALHRANDTKQDVAREVLAGRLTLAQAVDCYREIHEHLPISWASMRKHYPGDTDQERWCRNVFSWVQSETGDQPDQRAALAKLDLEMQRYLEEIEP
jgi:hypothetical protein